MAKDSDQINNYLVFLRHAGYIQASMGNYVEGIYYGLEGLRVIEKNKGIDYDEEYEVLRSLGLRYRSLEMFDKSLKYLDAALNKVRDDGNKDPIKMEILIDQCGVYIANKELNKASEKLKFIEDSLPHVLSIPEHRSSYNYKASRLHELKGNYKLALDHIRITAKIDSLGGDAQNFLYSKMQIAYLLNKSGAQAESLKIFKKCLAEAEEVGRPIIIEECLEAMYQILLEQGDSLKSFMLLLEYRDIRASNNRINDKSKVMQLELKNMSKKYQNKLRKERIGKIIEQKKQERDRLKLQLTIAVSIVILLLLVLIIGILKKKYDQRIMVQKKEIALYSTEMTSKNEAILQTINRLENNVLADSAGSNPSELLSMLNDLKYEVNNQDFWKDFEIRFRDVHIDFYKALCSAHPELTKNEIRLCALIKLNFSTKEIASITKKAVNSLNVAKHRLKAKLQIPKKQSLHNYLNSL